jgi:uncharacterized protein YqhQ
MFQIATLDGWERIARSLFYSNENSEVEDASNFSEDATLDFGVVIFFTSFIVLVVFVMLPVVVAVLLENFSMASHRCVCVCA